jgi:hypothetical protein
VVASHSRQDVLQLVLLSWPRRVTDAVLDYSVVFIFLRLIHAYILNQISISDWKSGILCQQFGPSWFWASGASGALADELGIGWARCWEYLMDD